MTHDESDVLSSSADVWCGKCIHVVVEFDGLPLLFSSYSASGVSFSIRVYRWMSSKLVVLHIHIPYALYRSHRSPSTISIISIFSCNGPPWNIIIISFIILGKCVCVVKTWSEGDPSFRYGNPEFDAGQYYHWNHRRLAHWNREKAANFPQHRHEPPDDIGSNFYPWLGLYSSRSTAVLDKHMRMIRMSGAGQ